jgi:AcrR family transcriptional regulator
MTKPMIDTRERLLQAALELFAEKGYAASGMAEILAQAQANSGSFYHFFRSKEDLLVAVLQRYEEMLFPVLLEPIWKKTADPIERIFQLLAKYRELIVASHCTYGCPIGRLALEVETTYERAHEKIAANFEGWAGAVEKCLTAAQEQGKIAKQIHARRLGRFVLTVMEGGVMQSRSCRSVEPFDWAVEELRQYFQMLAIPRSKPTGRRAASRRD